MLVSAAKSMALNRVFSEMHHMLEDATYKNSTPPREKYPCVACGMLIKTLPIIKAWKTNELKMVSIRTSQSKWHSQEIEPSRQRIAAYDVDFPFHHCRNLLGDSQDVRARFPSAR